MLARWVEKGRFQIMHIRSLLFLPVILIASCSPQASTSPSASSTAPVSTTPSAQDQHTPAASTPTFAPSTIQPSLSPTNTGSLFPSIEPATTPTDWVSLPKLSAVILSASDIQNMDQSASIHPYVTDITDELDGSCLWDCAKSRYSLERGSLTIMLLRAGDHQKAQSTVQNLRFEFLPTTWVEYKQSDLSILPPGSWVVVDAPSSTKDNRTSTAGVAYGSIVILTTFTQAFCDEEPGLGRICEGDLEGLAINAVKYLIAQMKKLEISGYSK
jgi:hypothetical protein